MNQSTINHFLSQRPWLDLPAGPHSLLWYEDFTRLPSFGAAGAGDAVLTETNAGATETLDIAEENGALKFLHTAADPDIIDVHWSWGLKPQNLKASPGTPAIEMGIRAKFSDVDDRDAFMGLSVLDADQVSLAADCVLLRLLESEGTGKLGIVSSKDSVTQTGTGLLTLADNQYFRAFLQWFPEPGNTDSGLLKYWMHAGGNPIQGQLDLEGVFPDDVIIRPQLQDATGAASAMTAHFDWFYVHALLADYVDGTG